MQSLQLKTKPRTGKTAFTLVEMLVVIVIISILMTAGSIGLSGMGGKGVTSGVATAESLFDEARTIAMSQRTNARVFIAKDLTNNKVNNLRRMVVAYAALKADGTPDPTKWILASRGAVLPDQTYFSQDLSTKEDKSPIDVITSLPGAPSSYLGSYFYYEFNAEGISSNPGARFVIGSGARKANPTASDKPKVTSSGKRDFGGFVIWRNGGTSVFRNPDQISKNLPGVGSTF